MKKQDRIIGTKKLYDSGSGELVEVDIVEADVPEREVCFHKLFLKKFTSALKPVADRKTQLCLWILENINSGNLLLYTYRQMADKSSFSYRLVADTMQKLLNADFLCRHPSGGYMVNPDIIFRGSYQRRCRAVKEYKGYRNAGCGDAAGREEMQLREIQEHIARLRKQEERLRDIIAQKKWAADDGGRDSGK